VRGPSRATAERQLKGYRRMLAVAERHGMEYEVERINKSIAEWEHELSLLGEAGQ
jgi:hypothetical protein